MLKHQVRSHKRCPSWPCTQTLNNHNSHFKFAGEASYTPVAGEYIKVQLYRPPFLDATLDYHIIVSGRSHQIHWQTAVCTGIMFLPVLPAAPNNYFKKSLPDSRCRAGACCTITSTTSKWNGSRLQAFSHFTTSTPASSLHLHLSDHVASHCNY